MTTGTLVAMMVAQALAQLDAGPPADGVRAAPPPVDAGVPGADAGAPAFGFDVVPTLWGPGRKSSGEAFSSAAVPLPEGPARWRWGGLGLAVGLQYFARGELRDNADLSAAAGDHALGFDQRARLSVRGSYQGVAGALVELQDVRAWGSEASTVGVSPFTGLHQGFVDVRPLPWLDLRVGRQELSYGEDRLVGSLDWAQAARAFDGVFARVTPLTGLTVDVFTMMLKPPAWGTAEATGVRFHASGSYFGGVYGRLRLGKAGVDVYGLGLFDDPSTPALGFRKDNNRVTLGARAFAGVGPLALVGEGAFQTGRVGQLDEAVVAGAFAARATVTAPVWGKPYLLLDVSGASGDGAPGDGVEHTFHQLFPTAHVHLGFMDYAAWQNVVGLRATVGFRPFGAHVWVDVHHLRAWDARGTFFFASGAPLLAADATRTQADFGTEVDLSATVPLWPAVALAGAVAVFVPGGLAASRGTSPSTWGFLSLRCQL